jgi:hypothetical protein
MNSIDHIAIAREIAVDEVSRVVVSPRLSDHDAYVVEAQIS